MAERKTIERNILMLLLLMMLDVID